MINKVQCLVFILASLYEINAFKYLIVSPIPGKSHAILGDALVEHIANAGHEVTYITPFVPQKLPPRATVVDVTENIKSFPLDVELNIKAIMNKISKINNLLDISRMMMNATRATIQNPNVQKLMTDRNQNFDAVIAEWMSNDVYAGFAGVFNCPLIWFSSVEPHWMVLRLITEMPNPACTASIFMTV